jgi:hypothetical protein
VTGSLKRKVLKTCKMKMILLIPINMSIDVVIGDASYNDLEAKQKKPLSAN